MGPMLLLVWLKSLYNVLIPGLQSVVDSSLSRMVFGTDAESQEGQSQVPKGVETFALL